MMLSVFCCFGKGHYVIGALLAMMMLLSFSKDKDSCEGTCDLPVVLFPFQLGLSFSIVLVNIYGKLRGLY